jgi:enamine deaminase RidA (YjgF/YER057c/UK114 family)
VANLLDEDTEVTSQLGLELDEPPADGLELPVDDVQPLVDGVEPLIDGVEPLVDRVEPLVEIGAKLGVHAGTVLDATAGRQCGNIDTFRYSTERGQSMSVKRLNAGPRMSGAVVNGNTVYLAGQVAEGASVKAQTEAVLKKIDDLLGAAGSSKANLLSTTIYLTDIRTFDEMNAVWDAWVSPGNTPARATVEARLANPKYLVEIMVTAAV